MIRRYNNGYEYFECSNCGEETDQYDNMCQICGHEFQTIGNQTELDDNALENETMCIVMGSERSGDFIFTQLKIDTTPKMLLNLPAFQSQRMMREPNPYEFYVFKAQKFPYLNPGVQINLVMDNYEYFTTHNRFKIFYNKFDFSNLDIIELKSYNFN